MPEPAARPASPAPTAPNAGSRAGALAVGLMGACASLLVSLPLVFSGRIPQRVAFDVVVYHEPAARQFAADWPAFDFHDYLSATTPGYHLLIAWVIRTFSASRLATQLASALIAALLAGVVGFGAGLRTSRWVALALTLPVIVSGYVVQSAAWTLPDDLGWLGVALVLVLCFAQRGRAWPLVVAGLVLAPLVLTRQAHVWAAGAVWAAAWMEPAPPGGIIRSLVFRWPKRLAWLGLALLASAPALGILWYFAHLWGGLTPPRFAGQHGGMNPATPAFVLALLGITSVFHGPWLWAGAVETWKRAKGWLVLGLILGFAAGRIPATTYDLAAGRSSGLWNLTTKFPVEGSSSSLIVALACLGGVALVVWVRALPQKRGVLFLAVFLAFTAAQTANHHCWQRYVEPFVLILTALGGARLLADRPPRGLGWLALGALVALLAAANVAMLRPFPTVTDYLEGYRREGVPPEGGPYVPKSGKAPIAPP